MLVIRLTRVTSTQDFAEAIHDMIEERSSWWSLRNKPRPEGGSGGPGTLPREGSGSPT